MLSFKFRGHYYFLSNSNDGKVVLSVIHDWILGSYRIDQVGNIVNRIERHSAWRNCRGDNTEKLYPRTVKRIKKYLLNGCI